MLTKPESACFLIADISGYTSFLTGVELDHAHDIITDVMNTVVRRLRPPFRLASISTLFPATNTGQGPRLLYENSMTRFFPPNHGMGVREFANPEATRYGL